MQIRRSIKHSDLLEDRLAKLAKCLRAEAETLPHGAARDDVIRRSQQAETGAHMSEWLRSPGLKR
jgi:hypothetical protein